MKTTCEDQQFALLEGKPGDGAHLASCADCRGFAASLGQLAHWDMDAGTPPEAVDATVLAHAAGRSRRGFGTLRLVAALAAAAAVAVAILVVSIEKGIDDKPILVEKPPSSLTTGGDLVAEALADDPELAAALETLVDADYAGTTLDEEMLSLELQLAAMQTENFGL